VIDHDISFYSNSLRDFFPTLVILSSRHCAYSALLLNDIVSNYHFRCYPHPSSILSADRTLGIAAFSSQNVKTMLPVVANPNVLSILHSTQAPTLSPSQEPTRAPSTPSLLQVSDTLLLQFFVPPLDSGVHSVALVYVTLINYAMSLLSRYEFLCSITSSNYCTPLLAFRDPSWSQIFCITHISPLVAFP
jgi:hypothetical protein